MEVVSSLGSRAFQFLYGHQLIFNTCWEDPRLDRIALGLGQDDRVLVITSAGCNALEYALCGPAVIDAVDLNPRQTALLELKLAGIRRLDHATFFKLFGEGRVANCREIYHDLLAAELSPSARRWWDQKIVWFSGRRRSSFYAYGTVGTAAWVLRSCARRYARLSVQLEQILDAPSVDCQREIYDRYFRRQLRRPVLRWALARDFTLALLGTPRPQREQLELDYPGGVIRFIEGILEDVFTRLPLSENYFWRVYLTGSYSPECCPEYLKPHNFERLKAGLVDRIRVHDGSLLEFLLRPGESISRFVLLDHMDWLSSPGNPILARQWQAILNRAASGARLIWRSAGLRTEFVDRIEVTVEGKRQRLGHCLHYQRDLASKLHPLDRAHTYGSFHIADLCPVRGVMTPHLQRQRGTLNVGIMTEESTAAQRTPPTLRAS